MAESLNTGLMLMVAGMGTVYLLLAVLVLAVHGVSRFSRRFERAAPVPPAPSQPTGTPAADAELVTVIGAAVAAHRRDGK
jgi:sodium pump decarboxylase gamma subunit